MTRYSGGSTVVQGGGGPNPTDAFSLGVKMTDSNVVPTDAMSVAFAFPDTIAGQTDLLQLGLSLADTNPALSDLLLRLGFGLVDSNATPTDAAAYAFGVAVSDSNAAPSDLLQLAFTLADANAAPTDARSSVASLWGTGSAGAGVTTPANADGKNDGTNFAVVSTAVAGAATETLTSNCGNAAAAGTFYTSIIFKGWYKLNTVLSTSTAKVVVHSSTAAFTDIVIETIAAVNTTNDHLTTPFTSGELIGTIDTLAKLQSAQIVYSTIDAVAGTQPAIVTVDASSLQLSGVI
jgi:hypothetical protein